MVTIGPLAKKLRYFEPRVPPWLEGLEDGFEGLRKFFSQG
jgi:hypothetical protein